MKTVQLLVDTEEGDEGGIALSFVVAASARASDRVTLRDGRLLDQLRGGLGLRSGALASDDCGSLTLFEAEDAVRFGRDYHVQVTVTPAVLSFVAANVANGHVPEWIRLGAHHLRHDLEGMIWDAAAANLLPVRDIQLRWRGQEVSSDAK